MSECGHNPMRWNCATRGCFNVKRRPKIEVFSDLFPGRINFGDVDGIVEINGRGLMLEWKSDRDDLPKGQQIMYERLTRHGVLTVIFVTGDAETMHVQSVGAYFMGKLHSPCPGDLEMVREWIKQWLIFVKANPLLLKPYSPFTAAA